MALVNCADCEREISDAAPACPHCGRPVARPELPVDSRGSAGNVLAALLSLLVPGLGQLTQGRVVDAIAGVFFLAFAWAFGIAAIVQTAGLSLLLPPALHLYVAMDAAKWNPTKKDAPSTE